MKGAVRSGGGVADVAEVESVSCFCSPGTVLGLNCSGKSLMKLTGASCPVLGLVSP